MNSPLLIAGILSAGFVFGAIPPLLDALALALQKHLAAEGEEVSPGQEASLKRRFYLFWILGMPIAGWIADVWSALDMVFLGLVGLSACLFLLALTRHRATARIDVLGMGVASCLLGPGLLSMMPGSIDVHERAVEALNLGFIAIGLGALILPHVFPLLERFLGLKKTALVLAALGMVPAGLLAVANTQPAPAPVAEVEPFTQSLYFWLLAFILLLYYVVESCLETWSGPFVSETSYRQRALRFRLFGFWAAVLIGRLAAYWMIRTNLETWVLLTCSFALAMILGNLVGAFGSTSSTIGLWIGGFCFGPLLPGFLGLMSEMFAQSRGLVLGLMLALYGLHHALIEPLLMHFMERTSARGVMRGAMMLILVWVAPLLLVTLMKEPTVISTPVAVAKEPPHKPAREPSKLRKWVTRFFK